MMDLKPFKEQLKLRREGWGRSTEKFTGAFDILAWMKRVRNGTWIWARNTQCKYVTIRVDTRSGLCSIRDRDGNYIKLHELEWQYSRETPQPKEKSDDQITKEAI